MTFSWEHVLAIIGAVLTILNIWDKLTNMKKKADAPMEEVIKRLNIIEYKMQELEQKLKLGNDNFRRQKKINTMFERIQLAFVDFEVAYCNENGYKNIENLLKAKKLLEELLTDEEK